MAGVDGAHSGKPKDKEAEERQRDGSDQAGDAKFVSMSLPRLAHCLIRLSGIMQARASGRTQ
ncbi:hypothetical protein C9I57_31900 [Trinickia symbiotica]|uniref:Uncharacterized protein n=1 Tax=Trinickia symbiotica TaxID=863227 RepID=A0A2T3XJM9_9BURK|nr:hypothetical protein C9I57_31900 [Trinickia symbiotica]